MIPTRESWDADSIAAAHRAIMVAVDGIVEERRADRIGLAEALQAIAIAIDSLRLNRLLPPAATTELELWRRVCLGSGNPGIVPDEGKA